MDDINPTDKPSRDELILELKRIETRIGVPNFIPLPTIEELYSKFPEPGLYFDVINLMFLEEAWVDDAFNFLLNLISNCEEIGNIYEVLFNSKYSIHRIILVKLMKNFQWEPSLVLKLLVDQSVLVVKSLIDSMDKGVLTDLQLIEAFQYIKKERGDFLYSKSIILLELVQNQKKEVNAFVNEMASSDSWRARLAVADNIRSFYSEDVIRFLIRDDELRIRISIIQGLMVRKDSTFEKELIIDILNNNNPYVQAHALLKYDILKLIESDKLCKIFKNLINLNNEVINLRIINVCEKFKNYLPDTDEITVPLIANIAMHRDWRNRIHIIDNIEINIKNGNITKINKEQVRLFITDKVHNVRNHICLVISRSLHFLNKDWLLNELTPLLSDIINGSNSRHRISIIGIVIGLADAFRGEVIFKDLLKRLFEDKNQLVKISLLQQVNTETNQDLTSKLKEIVPGVLETYSQDLKEPKRDGE